MRDKNRFLVFELIEYYPSGGWGDLFGACDTLEAAKEIADTNSLKNRGYELYDVVDLNEMKIVYTTDGKS